MMPAPPRVHPHECAPPTKGGGQGPVEVAGVGNDLGHRRELCACVRHSVRICDETGSGRGMLSVAPLLFLDRKASRLSAEQARLRAAWAARLLEPQVCMRLSTRRCPPRAGSLRPRRRPLSAARAEEAVKHSTAGQFAAGKTALRQHAGGMGQISR